MDRIDLFATFVCVVDRASFTKAAATLGQPRSSVSAAIRQLEDRLGTRLLHRTTRHVSPTQDGLALYERCVRLVAEVEDVEALFRGEAEGPAGRLRIDVPGRIGRLILAPALPDFLDRYPGIDVELGVTDRAVNLIEDRVDCVLRVGPLADSSLIARSLGELALINVASPAYLARRGTPAGPQDLPAHQAVNYASPSSGRLDDWQWREDGQSRGLIMGGRVTVNSAEASIACCLAGLGLLQIPAYDVAEHLAAGELVEVMPEHRADPMPVALLYPHRQHASRRLRVFVDWLGPLLHERLFR
ncbi:LysR family transcriptional regulator [Bosea sp. TWI1241]|uniref:LysR substrate-binding domain-containing protein n=1 Tax=Bosea sp. TWI1241 TaxID=3148904 RepID=UPI0032090D5D